MHIYHALSLSAGGLIANEKSTDLAFFLQVLFFCAKVQSLLMKRRAPVDPLKNEKVEILLYFNDWI